MESIKKTIEEIQSDNSKIWKEKIIAREKDNELFKEVLNFVYNPYILSGLSTKKINKRTKVNSSIIFNSFSSVLKYLELNNTGTDQIISNVQNYIDGVNPEIADSIKSIVTKSLKLGCNSRTINKAFGYEFIPTFDVMLANKWIDYSDKINGEFVITEKLDGSRNVAIVEKCGDINMFTRQGHKNEGFEDIENELKYLPEGYVYDGELIAVNDMGLDSADLFRDTMTKVRKDGVKNNVIFHVFDMIPLDDFKAGISKVKCADRKNKLSDVILPQLQWVKVVPVLYQGTDKSQISYWLDKLTSEGKEGCMVNLSNSPYECKRSRSLLKCKKMQSADLIIKGFEEGDGRLKGTLGRINVNYKGNTIGVGSGFTDADRGYFWNNQDSLLGKIVEVQFFEESSNSKTNEISLRFPIFKCVRDDKQEESYY